MGVLDVFAHGISLTGHEDDGVGGVAADERRSGAPQGVGRLVHPAHHSLRARHDKAYAMGVKRTTGAASRLNVHRPRGRFRGRPEGRPRSSRLGEPSPNSPHCEQSYGHGGRSMMLSDAVEASPRYELIRRVGNCWVTIGNYTNTPAPPQLAHHGLLTLLRRVYISK